MKRAWRISESARPRLHTSNARSSIHGPRSFTVTRLINECLTSATASTSESTSASVTPPTCRTLHSLVKLFNKKFSDTEIDPREMHDKLSAIRRDLLSNGNDPDEIAKVLDEVDHYWFRSSPKGSAFIELLRQLSPSPDIALAVWIYATFVPFFSNSYQFDNTCSNRDVFIKSICLAHQMFDWMLVHLFVDHGN